MFATKRIYDPPADDDGYRVLVDRLWPRGVSKERAALGEWMRDIGPSDDLRKWFHHDPSRWDDFVEKYQAELVARSDLIDHLRSLERQHDKVTLLYGARDSERNQALVIAGVLAAHRT